MKKMSKLGKSVLLSTLAALAFGSVAAGTSYALFTSDAKTDISVTTGKVSVDMKVDSIQLYSLNEKTGTVDPINSTTTFTNSGTFAYDSKTGAITLDRLTPGDKVEFKVIASNASNVNIKARTVMKTLSDNGLFSGLVVKINDKEYDGSTTMSDYVNVEKGEEIPDNEYNFSIELPIDKGNDYQGKTCELSFKVEAIQGNAKIESVDATTYEVYTATDLAAFAKKANAGTLTYSKVVLMNDIDMAGISYDSPHLTTKIDFDGNGNTIKNFTPSVHYDGSNYYAGLIGQPASGTKIHNINFEYAKIVGTTEVEDPAIGSGVVVGYLDNGQTSLEISDITVKNASLSKTKWSGGIIGFTSCPDVKVSNITVENLAVSSYTAGGVIGQVGGGSTVINNVVGSDIKVTGIKREGGMVGAVSGATLDITYDTTKYSATISETAIADKGSIVGLTGNNTTINGEHYYTVLDNTALHGLANLPTDKASVIELASGTYIGSTLTSTLSIAAGVTFVGRGEKEDVKWIQANAENSGYSFKGTKVSMKNLTLTSTFNANMGYCTGFPHALSTTFEGVKVLVDHENGAMGYWGDGDVKFVNCEFNSTNGNESNMFAYGGKSFTFENCNFTSDETAIKLYREENTTKTDVKVKVYGCTFYNNHSVAWDNVPGKDYKSAIQLDSPSATDMTHYIIDVKNSSIKEGSNYSSGILTGAYKGLIGVRTKANVKARNATLTIDDVEQDLGLSE